MLKSEVSPWPSDFAQFSMSANEPSAKAYSCHYWKHTQEASHWVEGCKGEAHRFLGMSPNLLRGFTSEKPQQLVGRPPNRICDAISKTHIPLILSRPWFLFSPLLTNPQLCSSGLSIVDRVSEKVAFLAISNS